MSTLTTLNFKELVSATIMGFTIGAIWVALAHVSSRPVGDGEVIFAAVGAAVTVTLVMRSRRAN
jgi:hypothetical protein